MNMNRPNPDNAVHVSCKARRTPDGVLSCTTNVRKMSSRELRLLRDEISGKAPEWTYTGKCFRPTGRWHDTDAGGEYVTANVQKVSSKRHVMYKQTVCMRDVLTGDERRFENVIVSDITTEAMKKYGRIKKRGMNIPCIYDTTREEWIVYT